MGLAVLQLSALLQSQAGIRIAGSADGKGNQHFVSVQTRIMASQILDL